MKHLVMLVPANFSSPLAHKGRSFIARGTLGFIRKREGRHPVDRQRGRLGRHGAVTLQLTRQQAEETFRFRDR